MALITDVFDYSRASESELIDGLADHAPLALAEAYHRTIGAGHAVARRLLSRTADVEALLRAVYSSMWAEPPGGGLEAWVRRQTFILGKGELLERQTPAASPSTASLIPELPAPDVRYLDAAERAIADLEEEDRRALLLAHDQGIPAAHQPGDGAAEALEQALLALAGPDTSSADRAAISDDECGGVEGFGDWCLGLADPATVRRVEEAIAERGGCAAKARALRRGRRRLEGLPATPDMGHRILVSVLASSLGAEATPLAVAGTPQAAQTEGAPAEPSEDRVAPQEQVPPEAAAPAAPVFDAEEQPPRSETSGEAPGEGVEEGAEPPELAADEHADWRPSGTDTAELRLSDILAEDDEVLLGPVTTGPLRGAGEDLGSDLDDLSDLEAEAPPGEHPEEPVDHYASLRDLEGSAEDDELFADTRAEGDEVDDAVARPRRQSRASAVLTWVLPIITGSMVGLLLALLIVGR